MLERKGNLRKGDDVKERGCAASLPKKTSPAERGASAGPRFGKTCKGESRFPLLNDLLARRLPLDKIGVQKQRAPWLSFLTQFGWNTRLQ